MLADHLELIETIGLDLFFAFIFIFIGLTIHDVMKTNNVPRIGQFVVYFVLALGCVGFVAKGVIQLIIENQGVA